MGKGRKISVTDMQMQILSGFDRTLRTAIKTGEAQERGITGTSGLLRNTPIGQWDTVPGIKRLTGMDKRIAELKQQIAEYDNCIA